MTETMLAPMDEDDDDFDFAKTEALPPEAFTGDKASLDETGEMPAVAQHRHGSRSGRSDGGVAGQ